MTSLTLLLPLALVLTALFAWAFRTLPGERWQVLAAVPVKQTAAGRFRGANLTWYGAFIAAGSVLAATTFLFVAAAFGVGAPIALGLLAAVGALGFASSRWTARLVERRRHTASVGGGVFLSFLAAPALILAAGRLGGEALPLLPLLAAMAVGYVFGEAVGRLACISFGCCYGKPLSDLSPGWRRRLGSLAFTFEGGTKKIAYASGLSGVPVVPIQALSAVVLAALGLASLGLLLENLPRLSLLAAVAGSQLWRVFSETLRADYRGEGRISAYQGMALLMTLATALAVALWRPGPAPPPDLARGLAALWTPPVVLALQAWSLASFLWSGWSQVTGSLLSFRIYRSRVTPRPRAVP